jgi:hypothetical protein
MIVKRYSFQLHFSVGTNDVLVPNAKQKVRISSIFSITRFSFLLMERLEMQYILIMKQCFH